MVIKEIKYTQENFPVEDSKGVLIYTIVSNCMDKKRAGIRQSGFYRIKPFYPPEPEKVVPALFGTLYDGRTSVEVLFLKKQKNRLGKLEITLSGRNERKLKKIQQEIKTRIGRLMKEVK